MKTSFTSLMAAALIAACAGSRPQAVDTSGDVRLVERWTTTPTPVERHLPSSLAASRRAIVAGASAPDLTAPTAAVCVRGAEGLSLIHI